MEKLLGIVGVIAAVVAAVFGIIDHRSTKGSLLKRIDRIDRRVYEIDQQLGRKYGIQRRLGPLTSLDLEKQKLLEKKEWLQRQL